MAPQNSASQEQEQTFGCKLFQFRHMDEEIQACFELNAYHTTGKLSVQLLCLSEHGKYLEPYCRVSINLDPHVMEDVDQGEFVLKDYSENQGIKQALLERQLIELTGRQKIVGGYLACEVVRLTDAAKPYTMPNDQVTEQDVALLKELNGG